MPDPDPGDADFAGKFAFVLGLAGFDHTGVFLGSKYGVLVSPGGFWVYSSGLFRRLAFPDDGDEPVIPLSLLGNEGGELP